MKNIITISREFGSGGHFIGETLAKELGFTFYGREIIAQAAVKCLEQIYPDALCSLVYKEPYELMIAGRLSAQCTDARVNIVTKELFEKYSTLKSFADADINDIAEIVKPCGLYRTKAKSIVEMTHSLYYDLGGVIPDSIEELTKLSRLKKKKKNGQGLATDDK